MNKIIKLFVVAMVLLGSAGAAFAVSQNFTVSATVPLATGVTFTVSKVTSPGNVFSDNGGTALNFNPLTFRTVDNINIYLPDHYFAIDIGTSGGAGRPTVSATYAEGQNPNVDPAKGLGHKVVATFVKVIGGATPDVIISKTALSNLPAGNILTPANLLGGFGRVYVGIADGNPASPAAGSEPFTNADAAGNYTGTLTLTAVVV